jgi:NifU-like protein
MQVAGGKIAQAKFQVFNCADQVAASSALTEDVIGKTLSEARALSHSDISKHLGGLEFVYLPPRLWAIDGLHAAIAAIEGTEVDTDAELDPLLCRCFGISEETIRQAVRVSGCTTVDEVVGATGAGTGCGTCRSDIAQLITEATAPQTAALPAVSSAKSAPVGRIQTLLRIQRVVSEKLVPDWQAQGAQVELWDFDGRLVKVRTSGSLADNAEARRTALSDLEHLIKAEIDAAIGVQETT